jgi:hypothetical protein
LKIFLFKALVVRVCFILGNMMAKSEDARVTFMKDSHSLQTLTKLLHSYIQLDSLVSHIYFFLDKNRFCLGIKT